MKRAVFAFLLLISICAAGGGISSRLRQTAFSLSEKAALVAQDAAAPQKAAETLAALCAEWDALAPELSVLTGRGCTDPIEESLARLGAYVRLRESAEIAAEASCLQKKLLGLWKSGAPLWENTL